MSSTREVAHGVVDSTASSYERRADNGEVYVTARFSVLADAIDAALRQREQEARAEDAKLLTSRADKLQAEWDAPPSAENGFMEMTADTPAGYVTWWGMNELRKLAKKIGDSTCTQDQ